MMSAHTGRAIDYSAHISQSIADILTTPVGSRVMRRLYGSYLPALVDQPATRANILRLQAATAQAIMKHEPRTKLRRVVVTIGTDGSTQISVERQDKGQAATARQTVSIGAAP